MSTRLHVYGCLILSLAPLFSYVGAAEEPASGYVADPEIEKLIAAAIDPEKAVAFPAQKRLTELGGAAERALNFKLFNEKTAQTRRPYAELIARCCTGRVGYRVTLELSPDGSGNLVLESDRTMLAECAQKSDRLNGRQARIFPEEELRRNPYGKVDLAKHIAGTMKYNQGATMDTNGRIIANGEVAFSNFDDFAAFATSFDRAGYHMLNGVSLYDVNDIRTLHFKKNPENDRAKATNFLLMFHDVKWEFVLDFKGKLTNQNATKINGGKYIWRFDCAQMLAGESEVEASFDPRAALKSAVAAAPGNPDTQSPAAAPGSAAPGAPVAILAKKLIRVALGKRYDPANEPNPNGPDTVAALDGSPSQPAGPDSTYQWIQTSGVPLNLQQEKLMRPIIKMRFYEVGKYTFELTRTMNGQTSAPAEVTVLVGDVPDPSVADNGDGSAAIQRTTEMAAPKGSGIAGNPERRGPPPEPKTVPSERETAVGKTVVAGPDMVYTPKTQLAPERVNAPSADSTVKTNVFPATNILVSDIRREEAEFEARRHGGPVSATPPSNETAAPPVVARNEPRELPPAPPADVPKPSITPEKEGSQVAASREIELIEIRREEDAFNRAHPSKVSAPEVPKVPKYAEPERVTPAVKAPVAIKETPVAAPKKEDVPDTSFVPPPKTEVKVEAPKVVPLETPKVVVQPKVETPKVVVQPKVEAPVPPKVVVKPKEEVPPAPKVVVQPKVEEPKVAVRQPAETPKPQIVKPDVVAPVTPVVVDSGSAQRGMNLIKAGQYTAAVDTLKPAAKANPKDEATKMALGIALFESAEKPDGYDRASTQAALDVFTDIIRGNDQNAQAFMYAGHCSARLDKGEEKTMYFTKAMRMDPKKVGWEIRWSLGNRNLKEKDYTDALGNLTEAESRVPAGNAKDPRLLRDLAIAFHNSKQDAEAIKRVNALWSMGYTPDATLVAELKKTSPDAVKVPDSAYAAAPTVPAPSISAPETKTIKPDVAPETAVNKSKIVKADPPEVPKAPDRTVPQPEVPNPQVAVAAPKPLEPKKGSSLNDLENIKPNQIQTPERPRPAAQHVEPQKEPAPHVVKPLPPVPESFEAALAAGKRAMNKGLQLLQESGDELKRSEDEAKQSDEISKQRAEAFKQKSDALKNEALDCWDEAESMFRGAWDLKPDDPAVKAQFKELAKQVGVVALVKSSTVMCKPNGLVVLSAEPSIIFPEDKKMYWVWQQIDGKALDLRREQLDKQMVGLRIKAPGIYKFELVVSDGSRGGNPVSVTVEVR